MSWRSFRVAGLVGVVLIALIALLLLRKPFGHEIVVKAYFSDAMNLRAGARELVADRSATAVGEDRRTVG
jgi:ABC-type transporter Mla subunit MlaD